MATRRTVAYSSGAGYPNANSAAPTMFTAACIAIAYRDRTPVARSLQEHYGMSRSSAYRWVAAFKAARGAL